MLILQTNLVPIWRDPNFILAVTTLITVLGKWLADVISSRRHDRKLDTITTQTNGINSRLTDANQALTNTVRQQAQTIAAVAPAAVSTPVTPNCP